MIAKNPIVSAVSFRMWRMGLSLCCVGKVGLAPLLVSAQNFNGPEVLAKGSRLKG